mmetsp:Transcript_10887/g.21336  ORF Transcript_10887/g.21336 Transcript_10887/m.21336 type:complete len:86 (+) Transcript_10887:94-351(+)
MGVFFYSAKLTILPALLNCELEDSKIHSSWRRQGDSAIALARVGAVQHQLQQQKLSYISHFFLESKSFRRDRTKKIWHSGRACAT